MASPSELRAFYGPESRRGTTSSVCRQRGKPLSGPSGSAHFHCSCELAIAAAIRAVRTAAGIRGHAATMTARSFSSSLPGLLRILLGVLKSTVFSAVILVGTLGFPSDAFGCIGVPAGARLCKYWRDGHLQLWIHTGVHSGAETECRLVATGVHSAQPRRVKAAAWPPSIGQRPKVSDHRTAVPVECSNNNAGPRYLRDGLTRSRARGRE